MSIDKEMINQHFPLADLPVVSYLEGGTSFTKIHTNLSKSK